MRRFLVTIGAVALFGAFAQTAFAAGTAPVAFAGGTAQQQASVRSALAASSFDWSLLPQRVTVHIGSYGDSYSTYGNVFLDTGVLAAGRLGWGVVQHELAHQVDFQLLDDGKRTALLQRLGGKDWCYGVQGLKHSDYGCERFASELAWAYWPAADNAMRPSAVGGESAGMPVGEFRVLLAQLLGVPSVANAPSTATAFAPKPKPKTKKR